MSTEHAGPHPDPHPGPHDPAGPVAADPSMEDILASIRRILNEDEGAGAAAHAPADTTGDVLDLEPSMIVDEPHTPPSMATAVTAVPDASPGPLAVPFAQPTLVAPEAAAAAAVSVEALMRTLASERGTAVSRGGPTIEDLVREEMRPLLKVWLDSHLAPMVERLVRAEIERVVSRMT